MKVYVVTQGEYSDYHIEAVFTDIEKAELFCATLGYNEYSTTPEIEEYEADETKVEGILYRAIRFDGRKYLYNNHYELCDYYEIEILRGLKPIKEQFTKELYGDHYTFTFIIPVYKYTTKEEAQKIAEDRWNKFVAEKENL